QRHADGGHAAGRTGHAPALSGDRNTTKGAGFPTPFAGGWTACLLGDVCHEEPTVLLEAAHDLDGDIPAGQVDRIATFAGALAVAQARVDVGDDVADELVGLRKAGRHGRRVLRGYSAQARIDREAESDDALSGVIGERAGVGDDCIEQLVHSDEVGAADVPVRLLGVDGEG